MAPVNSSNERKLNAQLLKQACISIEDDPDHDSYTKIKDLEVRSVARDFLNLDGLITESELNIIVGPSRDQFEKAIQKKRGMKIARSEEGSQPRKRQRLDGGNPVPKTNMEHVHARVERAKQLSNAAKKEEEEDSEAVWQDFFRDNVFKDYNQNNGNGIPGFRCMSKTPFRYGRKILASNCSLKAPCPGLSYPVPDFHFAFDARSVLPRDEPYGTIEVPAHGSSTHERFETRFGHKGLRKLAEHFGSTASGSGFDPSAACDFRSSTVSKATCFPWLICELKGSSGSIAKMRWQAANGAAVCLTLLANLVAKARRRPKKEDLLPVISITSKKSICGIWIAYISDIREKEYRFEMRLIWHGDLTSYLKALEFCRIMDNIHQWARNTLVRSICKAIDYWQIKRENDLLDESDPGERNPRASRSKRSGLAIPPAERTDLRRDTHVDNVFEIASTFKHKRPTRAIDIESRTLTSVIPQIYHQTLPAPPESPEDIIDRCLAIFHQDGLNAAWNLLQQVYSEFKDDTDTFSTARKSSVPDHINFNLNLQDHVAQSMKMCKEISEILSKEKSEPLFGFGRTANELLDTGRAAVYIVGIVGASGEGKSGLSNALIGNRDAARIGCNGNAVTTTANEYHALSPDDPCECRVEVKFSEKKKQREILLDYIQHIRFFADPQHDHDRFDKDIMAEYERDCRVAKDAFQCLFGDNAEMNAIYAGTDQRDAEELAEELVERAQELPWPPVDVFNVWNFAAETALQGRSELDKTIKNLWPLVECTKVFVKSEFLQQGIVLVDLPGLMDPNAARVQITEKYLDKLDHIIVVTNPERAIVNTSIIPQKHFPEIWDGSDTGCSRVTIVCTKSDNLDVRQDFLPLKNEDTFSEQETEALENAILRIDATLAGRFIEQSCKYVLMKCRQRSIQRQLQIQFEKESQRRDMKVFGVSSLYYWQGLQENNTRMLCASGICQLRAHCLESIADVQLKKKQDLLINDIPNLLSSIRDCIESSGTDSKERKEAISAAQAALSNLRKDALPAFMGKECFTSIIKTVESNRQAWGEAASRDHMSRFANFAGHQYHIFCQKQGRYKSRYYGEHDWNARIVAHIQSKLQTSMNEYRSRMHDQLEASITEMVVRFCTLRLRTIPALKRPQQFDLIVKRLKESLKTSFEGCKKQMKSTQSRMERSNTQSYVYLGMRKTYALASRQKGNDRKQKQLRIIENFIKEELFPWVCEAIEQDMRTSEGLGNDAFQANFDRAIRNVQAELKTAEYRLENDPTPVGKRRIAQLQQLLDKWEKINEPGEQLARQIDAESSHPQYPSAREAVPQEVVPEEVTMTPQPRMLRSQVIIVLDP